MATAARGILIAGNWKMNHAPEAAKKFFAELKVLGGLPQAQGLRTSLYVPAVTIASAQAAAREQGLAAVGIGAQNAHWEKSGAFTGELSGPLLQEIGVGTVLIAHSERRQFFGETDETARKRTESLLAQGFEVILCVGETRAEREAGQTHAVLERQLGAMRGLSFSAKLIIAYEPVWAIGTGLTATPAQAQEAHAFIRGYLAQIASREAAQQTQILYGGSVTPQNASELLHCGDIDGALVGGASLKAESFRALLSAGASAADSLSA